MRLLDEDIIKFQALYKSSFGKEISKSEALEKGLKLLNLMKLVYVPMTQEEYDSTQAHMRKTIPALLKRLHNHEPRIYFDQRTS